MAQADLQSIQDYLSDKSLQGLTRIFSALDTSFGQLESFPFLGREGRVEKTRELKIPRIPYFLVYTLSDDYHVDVERILHDKQKWPEADL